MDVIGLTPQRLPPGCVGEDEFKGGCLSDSGERPRSELRTARADVSQGGSLFLAPTRLHFNHVSSYLGCLSLKLPRNFMITCSFSSGNKTKQLSRGNGKTRFGKGGGTHFLSALPRGGSWLKPAAVTTGQVGLGSSMLPVSFSLPDTHPDPQPMPRAASGGSRHSWTWGS